MQLDSQQNWLQLSPALTASPQEQKHLHPLPLLGRDGSLSLQSHWEGKQLGSAQKNQTLISTKPSRLSRGKVMSPNGKEPVLVASWTALGTGMPDRQAGRAKGDPLSRAQKFLTWPQAHTAAIYTWHSHRAMTQPCSARGCFHSQHQAQQC